jgi:hypothetical protein
LNFGDAVYLVACLIICPNSLMLFEQQPVTAESERKPNGER